MICVCGTWMIDEEQDCPVCYRINESYGLSPCPDHDRFDDEPVTHKNKDSVSGAALGEPWTATAKSSSKSTTARS